MELHRFLLILDKETLSGNATVQKGLLTDLLQSYRASYGMEDKAGKKYMLNAVYLG